MNTINACAAILMVLLLAPVGWADGCSDAAQAIASGEPTRLGPALAHLEMHPCPAAVGPALALLEKADAKTARGILRALGYQQYKGLSDALLRYAEKADPSLHTSLVFAFLRTKTLSSYPLIKKWDAAADPSLREAQQVADVFWGGQDISPLREAVRTGDLNIKSLASPGLAMLGDAEGIRMILQLLQDSQDEGRNIAATALRDAPVSLEVMDSLAQALNKEAYFYVQQSLLRVLAYQMAQEPKLGAKALWKINALEPLLTELRTYDSCPSLEKEALAILNGPETDYQAVLSKMVLLKSPEAHDKLREIARSPSLSAKTRTEAIKVLAKLGDSKDIAIIRKYLNDANPELQAAACIGLALLNDQAAGPAIMPLLSHPIPGVRIAAMRALAKFKWKEAIPIITVLANSGDPEERRMAALALTQLKKETTMNDPIFRLGHDAFLIQAGGKNIYFDPFQLPAGLPKADVILVTHDHYDHLSPDDIKKIATEKTELVLPKAFADKAAGLPGKVTTIAAGGTATVAAVEVRAVPAYNPAKKFHPKGYGGLGYFVKIGATTYYHAGDTDLIPEMKDFPAADVCFLPVSGTYVMTAAEAAEATKILKCRKAVPMHYGAIVGADADAEAFKKAAACEVVILPKVEKIP